VFALVSQDGEEKIALNHYAPMNAIIKACAHFPVFAHARPAGLASIAMFHCVHKSAKTVGNVSLQTCANAINFPIHFEMVKMVEVILFTSILKLETLCPRVGPDLTAPPQFASRVKSGYLYIAAKSTFREPSKFLTGLLEATSRRWEEKVLMTLFCALPREMHLELPSLGAPNSMFTSQETRRGLSRQDVDMTLSIPGVAVIFQDQQMT